VIGTRMQASLRRKCESASLLASCEVDLVRGVSRAGALGCERASACACEESGLGMMLWWVSSSSQSEVPSRAVRVVDCAGVDRGIFISKKSHMYDFNASPLRCLHARHALDRRLYSESTGGSRDLCCLFQAFAHLGIHVARRLARDRAHPRITSKMPLLYRARTDSLMHATAIAPSPNPTPTPTRPLTTLHL